MQNRCDNQSYLRVSRPMSDRTTYLRRRIRERQERRKAPAITLLPDGSWPRARG